VRRHDTELEYGRANSDVARLSERSTVDTVAVLCLDSIMTIAKINVVSVPVSDPDRAKDFYVNVLGMEVLQNMPMDPDMRWIQVAPKGSETSITLVTWFPSMPAGSLKGLVLETPDLEATIAEVAAKGFPIDAEIDEQPWGRFVTFDDPDGNGLVLREPPRSDVQQ
jgi:catechol 2,3-dioxygenase-like lactoylglutathione lyase family enzyme